MVPALAVADKLTEPVPQRLPPVDELTVGKLLTLTSTKVRGEEVQPLLVAST
jgi:hypothetical protein